MRTITERFYQALENQLNDASLNSDSPAEQLKLSIKICKKAMEKLKNYTSSYSFQSAEEEIQFFKEVKPQFYSKYIYFINVYNFTMQRPPGSEEAQREYILNELADLKRFFDHNHAFYQYYRSGSAQMDEVYYTRGGFDVHVELEDFEEDELYSTSHDYKLSKVIANERFREFLNTELLKLTSDGITDGTGEWPYKWTGSKTDAVELIYALVECGVLNSGTADIKNFVIWFEKAFQIDLGNYYHKYTDMCARKKERTVFLDRMKTALIRRMDEKEEYRPPVPRFRSETPGR